MKALLTAGLFTALTLQALPAVAEQSADEKAVRLVALDYIESQITVNPQQIKPALHPKLKKRTYWTDKNGKPFLVETSYATMVSVAGTYNRDGKQFPPDPRIEIEIFDIDQRAASVKLTADEWIDYMHLMKDDNGEWKILNVLWQYHDTERHKTK